MAPSLFTLPALLLLFLNIAGLIYLCQTVKNGKKFCRLLPFFFCALLTVLLQLLIELNKDPVSGIILYKLQFLGFWAYFITLPLLISAITQETIKTEFITLLTIITIIISLLTLQTDLIISSKPFLYDNLYIARMGNWHMFVTIPLFVFCLYYLVKLARFINGLNNPEFKFIIPTGLGICFISGIVDFIGKTRGAPLFFWTKEAFSIGMLFISITIGIFILFNYSQTFYEYQRALIEHKNLLRKNIKTFNEFVQLIAKTIDAKDKYTAGHSMRVAEYATMIARELNLDERQIEILQRASLFHDIGKIGIPDGILNKKSSLNEKDRIYIYRHPILAKEILSHMSDFQELLDVIYHHHERYDGNGYPNGLKGDEIPLLSRIISVADAYDAMLSERPYRNAKTKIEAIKELLSEKGKQFDPVIVDVFIKILVPEKVIF
jgi:putative nucleotidyltransferase with HDIG domain